MVNYFLTFLLLVFLVVCGSAVFTEGRPTGATSRVLNRSISASNQTNILRLPSPTKLMLFSGFCAYLITVERLQLQIFATSLFIYIFILAMICLLARAEKSPPCNNYFANRKTRRITSPVIINTNPITVKSIDFSSCMNYVFNRGVINSPVSLTNLHGQSGLGLNLLWLQGRLKRLATVAGLFYLPSYSSPPCGLSRCPYIINIQHVVYFVKGFIEFFQKKVFFSGFPGLANGFFPTATGEGA